MTLTPRLTVSSEWGSGLVATVSLLPGEAADGGGTGWTVAFDAPFEIVNIWNGRVLSHDGDHYVIGNLDYDAAVATDGSTGFGFQAAVGAGGEAVGGLSASLVGAGGVGGAGGAGGNGGEGGNGGAGGNGGNGGNGGAGGDGGAGGLGTPGGNGQPGADGQPGQPGADGQPGGDGTSGQPGGTAAAAQYDGGWLHTAGVQLIDDSLNAPVALHGIAWTGMEGPNMAPNGLWARNYADMLDQVKALGFNSIRLPFSSDLLHSTAPAQGIDTGLNPDLAGLTGLQVIDKVVAHAGSIGLGVVLDHHTNAAQYGVAAGGLWFDATHSADQWVADWQALAARYAGNPAVIGADLHNEPYAGTWGGGGPTDWVAAAERAGNAILSVNPHMLVMVEGNWTANGLDYWWGGNLTGVPATSVVLNQPGHLVYAPHDYGNTVFHQPFFDAPDFPANLPGIFDRMWGHVQADGTAPLWLGEFGSQLTDPIDKAWFGALSQYLTTGNAAGASWAWWSLDPSSTDVGGLLEADWRTPNPAVLAALQPLLHAGVPAAVTVAVQVETLPVVPATMDWAALAAQAEANFAATGQWFV